MTKDYIYLGYRFFYSRHYHKWIVEGEEQYFYCESKQDAIDTIVMLDEEKDIKENFFED